MSVVYEQLKLVSCRMSFSFGGSRLSRHTHTLTCAAIQPHVTLVCRVNGLHLCIHVNSWIITHLRTPEEWKAEMALLADSSRTIYPQRSFFCYSTTCSRFRSVERRCLWLAGHIDRPDTEMNDSSDMDAPWPPARTLLDHGRQASCCLAESRMRRNRQELLLYASPAECRTFPCLDIFPPDIDPLAIPPDQMTIPWLNDNSSHAHFRRTRIFFVA